MERMPTDRGASKGIGLAPARAPSPRPPPPLSRERGRIRLRFLYLGASPFVRGTPMVLKPRPCEASGEPGWGLSLFQTRAFARGRAAQEMASVMAFSTRTEASTRCRCWLDRSMLNCDAVSFSACVISAWYASGMEL
jgi:hypothetical protein